MWGWLAVVGTEPYTEPVDRDACMRGQLLRSPIVDKGACVALWLTAAPAGGNGVVSKGLHLEDVAPSLH